jgi:5'-3' exonuclease
MILAIDGTNWIHALWHATGDSAPQLAAKRLAVVADYVADRTAVTTGACPFHVIVCWDRPSFRCGLYPEYKANRKEKDPGLAKALEEAPEAMGKQAMQISADGLEADDLLASLAAVAVASGQQAILCSADKDLYQCLADGKVCILKGFKTGRNLYDEQWVNESSLFASFGLKPSQWADYQCLVGEPGDNVPGCPGWGPVHTEAALRKCGSVERMLELLTPGTTAYNPWALPGWNGKKPPARHRNLLDWKEQYQTTRQLIELRIDVDAVRDVLR